MGISADESRLHLSDGELLFFNVSLGKGITLDNVITAEVQNRDLLFSLREAMSTLEFAVQLDADKAQGWYIRESNRFTLDVTARTVKSAEGNFTISDKVVAHNDDIWVPASELGRWFGLSLKPVVSQLQLELKSDKPLPVVEKMTRQNRKFAKRRNEVPQLPFKPEPEKAIDFPLVDVSTRTNYEKISGGNGSNITRTGTVNTTGDFAYGTLLTRTNLDEKDIISNARVTYKKETLEPALLGPLKARRFEIGDIDAQSQPITRQANSGLGFRVTNADPFRSVLDANTDISGYATPGWDAELYRGNQLVDSQAIGEDGRYNFTQVSLFSADNDFRVVLYGPQGEIREESIYIPVDTRRLTKTGTAYDVALTFDEMQAYEKLRNDEDADYGAPRLNARIEKPVGDNSRLTLGIEAGQENGSADIITHAGISTVAASTLLNANTAVDEKGEAAGELVARRNFGKHLFRNTTEVATKNFDRPENNIPGAFADTKYSIFGNELSLTGPLPVGPGNRPRYNVMLNYDIGADDDATTSGTLGFSAGLGRLSFNQQIRYSLPEAGVDGIDSLTALSGSIGKNRLRLAGEYEIKPEEAIQNIRASLQRSVGEDMSLDIGVDRYFEEGLTEASAQLNWQAGHVLLSPSIAYNSNGDVRATLNSRFGAARDPQTGDIRFFDRAISLNGGLSAFVFLDANGNGLRDDGEEPIEGAVIAAPQNGGREQTGKDGYAYFSRLERLRLTDVYLEAESLKDPYWVPGTKGVSILPREGHVSQLNFPVLMAGEIEGTVYNRDLDGVTAPVHGIPLSIYTRDGEKVRDTISDASGYYLLSPVPPGEYWLIAGGDHYRSSDYQRPMPAQVTIGYEGTIIRGSDIYMDAGVNDAPLKILASLNEITSETPGLNADALKQQKIVLNLGSYQSRVLMGVMWYKARTFQGEALKDLQTVVNPSESFAAQKTGLHTLRVSGQNLTLPEGTRRCGMLNAAGIKCTVEILPGSLQTAALQ